MRALAKPYLTNKDPTSSDYVTVCIYDMNTYMYTFTVRVVDKISAHGACWYGLATDNLDFHNNLDYQSTPPGWLTQKCSDITEVHVYMCM